MNKIPWFVFFTVFGVQFGFSQVFLGGSVSYQNSKFEIGDYSSDSDTVTVAPALGYRFRRADVGVMFQYQRDTTSSDNESQTILGGGIFGSYIFLSKEGFSILGRGNFQYLLVKNTADYTTTISVSPYYLDYGIEQYLHVITASITPVFEYRLFDHITLYTSIGSIGFSHQWGKSKISGSSSYITSSIEDMTGNSFGLTLTTGITLGFYVLF